MEKKDIEKIRDEMHQIQEDLKVIIIKVVDKNWVDVPSPLIDKTIHNCLSVFDVGCNLDSDKEIIVFDEEAYQLIAIENVTTINFNKEQELSVIRTDHLSYVCGYAKRWLKK